MRLIDADKLTKQIAGMAFSNNYPANKALALCKLIDSQPAACDVDKVVEQLEATRDVLGEEMTQTYFWNRAISKAIEIIKAGGIDGN